MQNVIASIEINANKRTNRIPNTAHHSLMTQLYVADTGIYAHKYSRTAHIIGYLINAAEKSVYTTIIRQKIIASFACRPSRLIKQFR